MIDYFKRMEKNEIAFVCAVYPRALLGCSLGGKKRFLTLACHFTAAIILKKVLPLPQISLMHFKIISSTLVALLSRKQDTSPLTQMAELCCSLEPLQLLLHKPLLQVMPALRPT